MSVDDSDGEDDEGDEEDEDEGGFDDDEDVAWQEWQPGALRCGCVLRDAMR